MILSGAGTCWPGRPPASAQIPTPVGFHTKIDGIYAQNDGIYAQNDVIYAQNDEIYAQNDVIYAQNDGVLRSKWWA